MMWSELVVKHRIKISALMVLAALFLARPSWIMVAAGAAVVLIGELIRMWASGHIHKMEEVTQTGPYALCRHPLYLGHFIITLGFVVMGNNIWLILLLPMFLTIFIPTMKHEESVLTEKFGESYTRYSETTPRFWPLWSHRAMEGPFDWSLVAKHREMNNIFGLIGITIIVAGIGYLRSTLG